MTPNFEHLEKLQKFTKEYSQFSKQSSGVAYMAILPLLIFAYWIGEQLPINWWGSFFGVVLSGVFITTWLFIRWRLILQFYQGFGLARAAKPEFQKGHLAGAFWGVGISLITILILRFISGLIQFPNTLAFTTPIVIFTLIMSYIVYQKHGFMIATTAFVFGAVFSGGINQNATNLTDFQLQFNAFGVGRVLILLSLVSIGIREHQKFKAREQKFKNLGSP